MDRVVADRRSYFKGDLAMRHVHGKAKNAMHPIGGCVGQWEIAALMKKKKSNTHCTSSKSTKAFFLRNVRIGVATDFGDGHAPVVLDPTEEGFWEACVAEGSLDSPNVRAWMKEERKFRGKGARHFVQLGASLLSLQDWATMASAQMKDGGFALLVDGLGHYWVYMATVIDGAPTILRLDSLNSEPVSEPCLRALKQVLAAGGPHRVATPRAPIGQQLRQVPVTTLPQAATAATTNTIDTTTNTEQVGRLEDFLLLHGCLTPLECAHAIQCAEALRFDDRRHPGYQNAQIDEQEANYRKNSRCVYEASFAEEDWLFRKIRTRLRATLPEDLFEAEWKLFGLNTMWRLYKYDRVGNSFPPHFDNKVTEHISLFNRARAQALAQFYSLTHRQTVKSAGLSSFYSVLVYLSGGDDFSGGDTRFWHEATRTWISVRPQVGWYGLRYRGRLLFVSC